MKNSYFIWIPSIQKYLRFYELSWDQLRSILKVIDDNEIEFIYQLNTILRSNIISDYDINRFTTLDRFVVFIFLKIYSCGPTLSLTAECTNEKCKNPINQQINLALITQLLGDRIDRSFIFKTKFGPYDIMCDIPTISNEYKIYEHNLNHHVNKNAIDEKMNTYIISHITDLFVNEQNIFTEDRDYKERVMILNSLPAQILNSVNKNFIEKIHNLISDISFIDFKCKKCEHILPFKFSFSNINEFLKIIFKDNSISSILIDHINLTEKLHINSEFLSRLSPMENDLIINYIKQSEKENQQAQKAPPRDLFEESYRDQTKGMQESKSEFT
jgi:hypothetical protein